MALYQTYTVRSGDTLGRIASRNATTVGDIVALNALSGPDRIVPGQILNIRRTGDTSYTVARGDSLSVIGRHYGVNVPALAEANGLAPPYVLQIGQTLTIPGAEEARASAPVAPRPAAAAAGGDAPKPGAANVKAAEIARRSVLPRSTGKCYRYVKRALLTSGAVDHYLGGVSAIEAGPLLTQQGFVDLLGNTAAGIRSPYDAPIGAVLVYKATAFATDKNRIHGHIEIRTDDGFASDYFSPRARTGPRENGLVINSSSGRALAGVFVKPDRAAAAAAAVAPAHAPPPASPAVAAGDPYGVANLLLDPANGKYRGFIEEAAQRTGMAPQTVAAVIDAEAAKVANTRQWDANSKAGTSSARGLTQFLNKTWLDEAVRPGGLLNAEAKAAGLVSAGNAILDQARLLALRFDPRVSILAGADLAVANFAILGRLQVLPAILDPAGRAKIAYLAHHEGAGNAARFLRGSMAYVSQAQFNANVAASRRGAALAAAGGNHGNAYRDFLAGYIDRMIDVTRFMHSAAGVTVPRLRSFFL